MEPRPSGAESPALKSPEPSASSGRLGNVRRRQGLMISIVEGMCAQAHTSFTGLGANGNAITIGFALLLGGGNVALGWLMALSAIGSAFQLVAAALAARLRARKGTVLVTSMIARVMWPAIGAIPFLLGGHPRAALAIYLALWGLSNALLALAGNLWVSWMADLCPPGVRGRYFARRNLFCGILSVVAALVVSPVLDHWFGGVPREGEHGDTLLQAKGFLLFFSLAGVAGCLSAWLIGGQPEPERRALAAEPVDLKWLLAPFRDRAFWPILLFVAVFWTANGIASPFWAVFQLQEMRLDYTYVNGYFVLLSGLTTVLGLSFWGKLSDRFGNRFVIALVLLVIASHPLYYVFASSPSRWPLMLLDSASSGLGWSGYNMAVFNLVLALAPTPKRELYYAAYSTVLGIAMAVSAALAGFVVDLLPPTMPFLGLSLDPRQQIFLATSVARIGCLVFFLAAVTEPKGRPIRAIVAAASSYAKARIDQLKFMPRD